MHDQQPLDLLLDHRKEHWLMHCSFVLERLLMPLCRAGRVKTTTHCQRAVVLIDNRIDKQWLFTVLNTRLMCPKDSKFVLITRQSNAKGQGATDCYAPNLKPIIIDVAQIAPGVQLTEHASFNAMLKRTSFGRTCHMNTCYSFKLTPFLPNHYIHFSSIFLPGCSIPSKTTQRILHHAQYRGVHKPLFQNRFANPWVAQPRRLPPLARQRRTLHTIQSCNANNLRTLGSIQPGQEAEDVFFSRHIGKVSTPAPLEIAQAFATETTYNPNAIGSHACWKFLEGSDLAHHFEQHLREAWAMTTALKDQAK